MFRCVLATLALAALAAPPAAAQLPRSFTAAALRGELVIQQPPEVLLNGRPARLAPGVRIKGPDNLLQMSASLVGARLVVNYTFDSYGLVHDVWILGERERAVEPWPRTPKQAQAWSFDPFSQTWSKP